MKMRFLASTLVLLTGLIFTYEPVCAQQANRFDLTPIVATGDELAAPVTFAQFGTVAINNAGQIAFIAGDQSGLYRLSGGAVTTVAQTSEPVPGLSGVFFDEITTLALNNQGQIAFVASLVGARGGVGLFLYSQLTDAFQPIVFSGDRVPGPVFANFQNFTNVFLTDQGQLAFTGTFRDTEAGAFLVSNGAPQPIAVPNQDAPGTSGGQFRTASVRSLAANGTMLIHGSLRNGSATSALFLYRAGSLQPILFTGQAAPVGGTFSRFSNATLISEAGDVVFEGFAIGGSTATGGIFVLSSGQIQTIVLSGQPIAAAGGKSILEFSAPASNLQGDFCFRATFTTRDQGLFFYSRRTLSVVVLSDRNVSGSFARRFIPTGATALNAQGTIAYVGETATPTTTGVYLVTGNVHSAAVTSQTPVPAGRRLRLGSDVGLGPDGAVVFSSVLTGNGKGLYISQNDQISPQVVPGQAAPDAGGGMIRKLRDLIADRYAVTDQHTVAFSTTLSGGTATVGAFQAATGALASVGVANQSAPGLSQTTLLDFDQVVVNNSGTVAFNGIIRQGTTDKEAILLFANRRYQLVAAADQTAPGGSRFASFLGHDLWINAAGDVVFVAELEDGRQGVYRSARGRLQLIALSEQVAPGAGGQTFGTFGSVMINNQGMIVFDCEFFDEEGGGVFRFANDQLSPVALSGAEAPGTNGRTFTWFSRTAINEAGQIAFFARWGSVSRGVFFFANDTLTPVALSGQLVPGSSTSRFFEFYGLSLNDRGDVVLTAALDSSSLPSAIFLATATGN